MSDINVIEAGRGPALLCLHGIGGSSASFEAQFAELAEEFRLIAWDAPGYAASADPARAFDLDDYADAAAEVLTERADGPADVLGVSWGGVIAMRLALRHPQLVRSLILADSSRGSARTVETAVAMRARVDELASVGVRAFAEARGAKLVSALASADLVERVTDTMAAAIRLPGYGYAAESMAATDLSDELAKIAAPTLVLCGSEDAVTGIEESQALAGGISDAVFVTLHGAGHQANQETPGQFNAWISAYLHIIHRLYG